MPASALASGARVFICRFFERMMPTTTPIIWTAWIWYYPFWKPPARGSTHTTCWPNTNGACFAACSMIRRFETLLRQSNMETLMLHGVRAPHASPGELIHHMRLIDLICLRIFGKTETIDLPMEEPLRQVSGSGYARGGHPILAALHYHYWFTKPKKWDTQVLA
jgi:hypothetical protein